MRETNNYDVHGLLRMQINRNKIFDIMRDINLRFSYFEVDNINDPELIVNIGKFKPRNRGCVVVDREYYVKKGYIYSKGSYKTARWEFEIIGLESSRTILNFNGKILGLQAVVYPDVFVQNFLVRALIELKLSRKDALLLHAAALSKDDKAFILLGRGGANKTSLTMDFVRRGNFALLGDDWIIVKGEEVMSFPTHFIEFNFRTAELQTENLRGKLDILRLIWYLNKKHNYRNMPAKVKEKSKVNELILLIKTNKPLLKIHRNESKQEILKRMILNNHIEMTETCMSMGLHTEGIIKYLLAYSLVFPDSYIASYLDDFKKRTEKLLENIDCYLVEMPVKYSKEVYEHVGRLVK